MRYSISNMGLKRIFSTNDMGLSKGTKSGIVFAVAQICSKGVLFITIPIFTRLMSTEEIGIVNLYNSWYMIISVFTTLSLTSGGYQLALKEFSHERDQYVSSVLSITSLATIIIAIVYFFFKTSINKVLGLPESLVILLLIGFMVSPAFDFWLSRQRYEYHYKFPGFISIFSAIAASSLSICVVLYMSNKGYKEIAVGRLWANNIIIYGISFFFWLYIMQKGRVIYNKVYWRYSLSISIPLMGHAIAKQILDVSDRQMISRMVGNSEVGIYGTLYSVSSISIIVWYAINTSYIPYLYKNIDNIENKKKIQSSSFLLLCLFDVVIISILFLAPEIIGIIATKEYYEAISIMPPVAVGVILTAISNMYSNVLIYYKKSKYIMIASFTAAITNVVLNLFLIKRCGYEAAAYTTLVSFVLLDIIEGTMATKVYKEISNSTSMLYNNVSIIQLFLLTCVLGIASYTMYDLKIGRIIIWILVEALFIIVIVKRWRADLVNN